MKKKVILICALVVSLACAVGGTMAYFVAKDTAHNVITSGKVGVTIVEQTKKPNGELETFPEDGLTGIMPGMTVDKIVWIESEDKTADCWIRAKIKVSIIGASGEVLPSEGVVECKGMDAGWEKGNDGYYYYKNPVAPGKPTAKLMQTVTFDAGNMTNEYQGCTANVVIHAQAVQTANNGTSYTEAKGWPAEEEA